MFHCDDPARDDETKEYLLTAIFRSGDFRLLKGTLPEAFSDTDGDVLDVGFEEGRLRLGISWRTYPATETDWTEIEVAAAVVQVDEEIRDIA